jgi:hypothetical protein
MGILRFDITASIRHEMTKPSSSNSISVTTKCFSLLLGVTAVHLLLSNFLGLILFIESQPARPTQLTLLADWPHSFVLVYRIQLVPFGQNCLIGTVLASLG